jgi:integrase
MLFHRFIVSEKGNERRRFVEEPEYRRLVERTAGQLWLRGLLALGYNFGFHKAELLETRCSQVDLLNNTVSLHSGETKNGEPRIVVLPKSAASLSPSCAVARSLRIIYSRGRVASPSVIFAEHGTPASGSKTPRPLP